MPDSNIYAPVSVARDVSASVVVFFVALPLCLGIALACGAPPFAGLVAGIVGGVVVGLISGSHTSVAGPSAGLVAVAASQIVSLGSFEAFLLAVMVAGGFQIVIGACRIGFVAAFFPASVIKGLLAAIGAILVLKQIPHLLGHDTDPEGETDFEQYDQQNTLSELYDMVNDMHPGAATIGLLSIGVLLVWGMYKPLRKSNVPAPLVVIILGIGLNLFFEWLGGPLDIDPSHLVQVPIAKTWRDLVRFLRFPDFSQLQNPAIYTAGLTLGVLGSLETLFNIEAIDKLDPKQRVTPASRELIAQGIGNICTGLVGGLPVSSMVVRGSVNINAGAQSKISAILHGFILLTCVIFLPVYLNEIPRSCLGAILLHTGMKLIAPTVFKRMWTGGIYQFIPFFVTFASIIFTNLMIGLIIGLGVSISFILYGNLRRPVRQVIEKHLGGNVLHIQLANQVSFLNRASLEKVLREIPRGGQVLLDATNTDYIDPDVLDFIRDFRDKIALAHGVQLSLRGFGNQYELYDDIRFVDYSTRALQNELTSQEVLEILLEGNERFRTGNRLTRDFGRQLDAAAKGQHPLAVVLSCIDSRNPAELIFDLGLGDIFNVRVAGNVTSPKILGSMEYGCAVAGARLLLVMGHTKCGAVGAAVRFACTADSAEQATGCQHLEPILHDIQQSIDALTCKRIPDLTEQDREEYVDEIARRNVRYTVRQILDQSRIIAQLVREGRLAVVGAIYDVSTGTIHIHPDDGPERKGDGLAPSYTTTVSTSNG